jgi:Ferritin-like domain
MKNENPELTKKENTLSRRNFAQKIGVRGLGVAGAMWLGDHVAALHLASQVNAQSITDADILNFALNLEYLEAEFYTRVTTGKTIQEIGIPISGTGTPCPTVGGNQVNFRTAWLDERQAGITMEIAEQLAHDEQQHVILLRNALGTYAVARPAINLEALGFGFSNYREYLQLARAHSSSSSRAKFHRNQGP